ncbi:Putative protein kinase domain, aminoglycoside phosphotransferase [Septoria linicola]|uniref:Protein kinase domain-containing protein n=1 Tax=Septoria linicola TaxID=215465 RepID=A0A9Q9AXP8_9PEZI|nr:Putative protein kinase domain, aminoglycoside phosphotransferase [Septoria linicola]
MPFTDLELRVVIVRPGTRNQVLLLNRNGPEVPSIRPGMSISESTTQVVLEELRLPLEHRCFFGMQFVDLAYAPFFQDFDAQDIHRAIVCITVAVDNSALRSGHVLAWYPDLAGRHPTHIWADVTSSQASQAFGNAPFSTIRQIDIDGRVSCFTRAAQELPLAERQTLCKDIFGSMMSIKAFIEGIMVDDVLFVTSIKASRTRISLLPVPIGMHFAACRRAQGFWCDDPTNIFAVVGSVKGSLETSQNNEKQRLDERYLKFDITALTKAAATSMGRQHEDVQSIKKLAEGGFNRVFEVTMRDGFQLIARLPYPVTQPKSFPIASEAATMAHVRKHGVPTPAVYAYSHSQDNPVGAEYMMMEKIHGRCLGDIWYDLSDKERVKLLGEIVDREVKLFGISLPACGSIYHADDLPSQLNRVSMSSEAENLCIGPDVSLKTMTSLEVLQHTAEKELAWLRKFAKPRLAFDRVYREMLGYQRVDPLEHIQSLEMFLKLASHIVPEQKWLQRPTLRHPDLNPNNVFVDDDCNIVSIIDWQHSNVLPLFLNAGIPASLQNYGDQESEQLRKPELPADMDEMDEEDRLKDMELYRRRHAHFYHVGATAAKHGRHYDAMALDNGLLRKKMYRHAAEPWEGNSIPLKADIVQLGNSWSEMASDDSRSKCPIQIDQSTSEDTMETMMEQEDIDSRMEILRDMLGVSQDGWVSNERYDVAVIKAAAMKEEALGYAHDDLEREMTARHWPFDDFDEEE